MATRTRRSSPFGEALVLAALVVLVVGLLVAVGGLFAGLAPTALANGTASVPPTVIVGVVSGFIGGGYLAVIGLALVLSP